MTTESLPQDNSQYQTRDYWDQRYRKETADGQQPGFDWFKSYTDLQPLIHDLIPDRQARILMLGCGNSTLSKEMYDDGYQQIVNVDYSQVLIDHMRQRHPEMQWLQMDVRQMDAFPSQSFDVLLDKGTMDALLCERHADPWAPSPEVRESVQREMDEAQRLLRPNGGRFIYITFGQPHFRRPLLERTCWHMEVRQLGDMFHYYCYVLTKQ